MSQLSVSVRPVAVVAGQREEVVGRERRRVRIAIDEAVDGVAAAVRQARVERCDRGKRREVGGRQRQVVGDGEVAKPTPEVAEVH